MTKLTIWGRATSSNVQAVMWAVAELGLEHERHDVGGSFGGTNTPEYRAMNPMGLVPTFRDGDLTLFESAAIVRYLGARYGDEAFWPTDPAVRAPMDVIAEWAKSTFYQALTLDVFWQLIRTPAAERDPARIRRGAEALVRFSSMIENWLGDKTYLGGSEICFADIMIGHFLYRYHTLDFERAERPILSAYYDRLTARPAYREHVMVDYSVLKLD